MGIEFGTSLISITLTDNEPALGFILIKRKPYLNQPNLIESSYFFVRNALSDANYATLKFTLGFEGIILSA